MNQTHAVPTTTIPLPPGGIESRQLMLHRRAEAQERLRSALAGGLDRGEALAKAAPLIRAASRAQVMYRAELAHVSAGALGR